MMATASSMAVLTKEGDSGPHIHNEHGQGLKHGLLAKQGDSDGLEHDSIGKGK
jgi:hypothetical protein